VGSVPQYLKRRGGGLVELGRPRVPMPLALRWDGAQRAAAAIRALKCAIRKVRAGASVVDSLCDGELDSWYARQAVGTVLGSIGVPQWDANPLRTKAERLATLRAAVIYLKAKYPAGGDE
jgi:hypothetical protein